MYCFSGYYKELLFVVDNAGDVNNFHSLPLGVSSKMPALVVGDLIQESTMNKRFPNPLS